MGTVLLSLFKSVCLLIALSCLIALSRTISTILNKRDESRYTCFVPDFRRKSVQSFTINYNVKCRVFCGMLFFSWRKFPSIPSVLSWILSNAFSASIEIII